MANLVLHRMLRCCRIRSECSSATSLCHYGEISSQDLSGLTCELDSKSPALADESSVTGSAQFLGMLKSGDHDRHPSGAGITRHCHILCFSTSAFCGDGWCAPGQGWQEGMIPPRRKLARPCQVLSHPAEQEPILSTWELFPMIHGQHSHISGLVSHFMAPPQTASPCPLKQAGQQLRTPLPGDGLQIT